jgi:ribonuclease Z
MRLIFLGTGGYHPNERRHTACVFLPEAGIVLDAGTAFFRIQPRLQTKTLDVLLTHAHLDHVCGLTFPLVPVLTGELAELRVHGAAATLAAVREHLFAPALFPLDPPFAWNDLPDGKLKLGGCTVSWTPLQHPGGALGYRLDWADKSLAYITDTTAPGDYGSFIRGVDLLIHECYFSDDQREWAEKTGHSCATNVALVAAEANVNRLMLVHVDPQHPEDDPIGMETVRAIFPNAELAEDLREVDF